jgi:hypothetical protein
VHLVKLVVSWEEREQGQDFKIDATHTPVVHLLIVVPIGQQAFWRSVPTR